METNLASLPIELIMVLGIGGLLVAWVLARAHERQEARTGSKES